MKLKMEIRIDNAIDNKDLVKSSVTVSCNKANPYCAPAPIAKTKIPRTLNKVFLKIEP
jgi:hypothetical protein